jgi:hypothetical protein
VHFFFNFCRNIFHSAFLSYAAEFSASWLLFLSCHLLLLVFPCLQVRSAWSSYLELLIEPAGWLAVWIPSAEVSLNYIFETLLCSEFLKEAKDIKKICRASYMILDDFCSFHPSLAGVFLWSRIFHILDKSDYRKTFINFFKFL